MNTLVATWYDKLSHELLGNESNIEKSQYSDDMILYPDGLLSMSWAIVKNPPDWS